MSVYRFAYELVNHVVALEDAILEVIPLGGHWEIWLQHELARRLTQKCPRVELERKVFGDQTRVDISVEDGVGDLHYIELKVEGTTKTGHFGGLPLYSSSAVDIFKLQRVLDDPAKPNCWFLMVGHRKATTSTLEWLGHDAVPTAYGAGKVIAAIVVNAESF